MRQTLLITFCMAYLVVGSSQLKVETLVDSIDASGGVKIYNNHIYAANFGESLDNANGTQVYRITQEGIVSLFATGLSGASGNDFDSKGNLFQSNIRAGTVSKITSSGVVSQFATQNISCNVGIVIDESDNLYVCNCCGANGNTIQKVASDGAVSLFSSGGLFNCPNGITRDNDGNFYVSNFSNGNIIKITPAGNPSILATTPGAFGDAPSNGHIVFAPKENVLYVASHGSHSIYRLTLDGTLTRICGTGSRGNDDGDATQATFSRPNGIAITASGDTMYVNSSIPVTNANGRPLNPSKIRMITGFRELSSVEESIEGQIDFHVFPNPGVDKITILNRDLAMSKWSLQIYSMDGTLFFDDESIGENKTEIDVSQFPMGSYIVILNQGNQYKSNVIEVLH